MNSKRTPHRISVRRRSNSRSSRADVPASGELAESRDRLHLALEGAGLGAWDYDVLTGEQVINAQWAELLGYHRDEFDTILTSWEKLIHPDDTDRVLAAIQDHLAGCSEQYEVEFRMRTRESGWLWILSRGRVVTRDADGRPLRMAGTHRDISEHRQVEEALQRRDAILDTVSSTAELLLKTESWQNILPELLARLGHVVQASRAFLFQVFQPEPGDFFSVPMGTWTAPGLQPDAPPDRTRVFCLPRWQELLSRGTIIQGNSTDFLPEEQAVLQLQHICSLIVVPILTGERCWGLIEFDDCQTERRWLPAEEDALKVAANVLAAGIQRQSMFEAEREEQRVAHELREITLVLSQSLNYDRILDHLLEQAARVVPFDGASVLLVDGCRAHIARFRGYDQPDANPLMDLAGRVFEIEQTPNLRRMFQNRQAMAIPDTRDDPEWVQIEHFGYRSWVGAPLIQEGAVIAFLTMDKNEPHFYTSTHAQHLALFTNQAGLALSNARLFAETLQALEREQRLGEVTRAISSELDLPVILQQVVRLAVELAGAEAGSMCILDENTQTLTYPYLFNLPAELSRPVIPSGEGLVWDVIYNRRSLLLDDYPHHAKAVPSWIATGVHSMISVPVLVGNTCLGALGVVSFDIDQPLEPRDLALVEMVGRQAGVAIQNARLFEAVQRRAAEAETLRQAASAVSSNLELDIVLQKILEQLETVLPFDSATIFLFENEKLYMKAAHGFSNLAELTSRQYSIEHTLMQVIEDRQGTAILEDAQADPHYTSWVTDYPIRGWLGLTLRVREQKIGYLTVDSCQVGAYRQSDADLAQVFADETAIAIENARLFQQVQQLAITDPLTSLYNRRYFLEAARREYERAFRYASPMAVILIDLDHFKWVNDTYGHLAGDRVLVSIASRCRAALREVDLLARFGGEEFILLLPQTNLAGALLLAERLRTNISNTPVETGNQSIVVSASLGIAELDETNPDLQSLILRADQALYAAKHAGRGKVAIWTPELA